MAIYNGLWSDWSWVFPQCPLCELTTQVLFSPHFFFRKTRSNLICGPWSKLMQNFKNKLLALKTSGMFCFVFFCCSWQTSVNMLSTSQIAAASSNPQWRSLFNVFSLHKCRVSGKTKHTMLTAISSYSSSSSSLPVDNELAEFLIQTVFSLELTS